MNKAIKKKAVSVDEQKTKESFLLSPKTGTADSTISDQFRTELGRFIEGNKGGPKRYNNAEELTEAILQYFQFCHTSGKCLTMTGLGRALGFRSRNSLINYEKEPGYEFAHDVISYAKMVIEEDTEQRLHDPKNYNISGAIFSLKNNWNWVDKSEVRVDERSMQLVGFNFKRNKSEGNAEGDN
jgi:hypothetical protein